MGNPNRTPTARGYHETIRALTRKAPTLTPEQQRKLAATFGGGPR